MAALSGAAATAGAAGAADSVETSGRVLAVAAVVVCQWLHHVRASWPSSGRDGEGCARISQSHSIHARAEVFVSSR